MLAARDLAICQLLFTKLGSKANTNKHSHSVQTRPWASSREGSKASEGWSMRYCPLSLHESPNTINLLGGCFHRFCTRGGSSREGSSQARYRMPHKPKPTMRANRLKSLWCFSPTPPENENIDAANSAASNTELLSQFYLPSQIPHRW